MGAGLHPAAARGSSLDQWWHNTIIGHERLPLLVALASFVLTFAITRGITTLIRAGRGPFKNLSVEGTHIHHVVPGVIITALGGFLAIGARGTGALAILGAAVFGIGIGLVLDEFALILHLHDVYWTPQGRLSVEVVVLTTALVAMFVIGVAPAQDVAGDVSRVSRAAAAATVVWNLMCTVVAVSKGRLRLGLVGVLVPAVSLIAALRLARPDSWWAKRLYRDNPRKAERAHARFADQNRPP
ncbi:hypothetical protein [Wenjunlia tyrosinilytica]|uniref:Integral membrane protein n=1 Tax=Wenjunlia tyrosinilytica TaxID=1544741 RepID=A0A917ZT85_9ACTN|nr:hypothetical protein [Wenjunlia tyrosinilytica]GGO90824.1 hypothetical protein GCM10012280_37240 [Wenjunlia tyrosinilytica]